MKTRIETLANTLLATPMEQWHSAGIPLLACSANADGLVNSFITRLAGQRWHGWRKHEYVNGAFTGRQSFEVTACR